MIAELICWDKPAHGFLCLYTGGSAIQAESYVPIITEDGQHPSEQRACIVELEADNTREEGIVNAITPNQSTGARRLKTLLGVNPQGTLSGILKDQILPDYSPRSSRMPSFLSE